MNHPLVILASEAPPASAAAPAWMFVFAAGMTLVGVWSHWRFRTGRGMTRYPLDSVRGQLVVNLGYMALPGAIAFGGATVELLLFRVVGDHPGTVVGYAVLLTALVVVGALGWGIKEYFRPSKRRTPDWLRN